MSVHCEREIPKVTGLKDQEITVGRHVVLKCNGSWDKAFSFETADVKLDEKSKYMVKILKAEARSLESFDVNLAFYSAGEFRFPDLIISDGQIEIPLGPHNFKIETVIEKAQDGKQPQPFGPILPYPLAIPVVYYFYILGFFAVLVGLSLWMVNRRLYFKKLITRMKDYDSSTEPDLQFYKAVRAAEATGYRLSDLEKAFRLYILRAYEIPAFDLGDSALLSFFKKTYPWLKKERLEVKKLLEEFKPLENKSSTEAERKNLVKKLYAFVDYSETVIKKVSR